MHKIYSRLKGFFNYNFEGYGNSNEHGLEGIILDYYSNIHFGNFGEGHFGFGNGNGESVSVEYGACDYKTESTTFVLLFTGDFDA